MKKLIFIFTIGFLAMSTMAQDAKDAKLKPALLVIDMQNAYLPMMDQSDVDAPIKTINGYIGLFNSLNLPVIYIYHQNKRWGPPSDSKEFQFVEQIQVPEDAIKVTKNYGNAFNKTDLDKILKEKGVNTVFLCGLSATGCVMATSVGASDLDYELFWIKNATLSPDKEQKKVIESIFETVGYPTIKFLLAQ